MAVFRPRRWFFAQRFPSTNGVRALFERVSGADPVRFGGIEHRIARAYPAEAPANCYWLYPRSERARRMTRSRSKTGLLPRLCLLPARPYPTHRISHMVILPMMNSYLYSPILYVQSKLMVYSEYGIGFISIPAGDTQLIAMENE